MAHRKTQTVATGYMQMMAEKAAASRTTLGSGSASGSGTASVSTNPTPPLHVGTSSPVQTETPPPSIPAEPDGAFLGPFDNCVSRSIADIIKGYFTVSHPNWSKTSEHIKKTLFKLTFGCLHQRVCDDGVQQDDKVSSHQHHLRPEGEVECRRRREEGDIPFGRGLGQLEEVLDRRPQTQRSREVFHLQER
ncbi:unnamed protein product [Cochlearia groenlandica]